MSSHLNSSPHELQRATALLQAALHLHTHGTGSGQNQPPRLFVTVSRQPGAAGRSFAHRLVERLSNKDANGQWACWDQEFVEKVSAEHDIEKAIVAMVEDRPYSWMGDLLENLSSPDAKRHPDEYRLYVRVATTIQALANAGRAVIVGRGGVFITSGLPGGIHVRIVAPLSRRIAHLAEREGISRHQAEVRLAEIEHNRAAFYRRHWPGKSLVPEVFTITLNSAELSHAEMVECVLPIIESRLPRPAPAVEMTTIGGARPETPHVAQTGAFSQQVCLKQ